MTKRPGHGVYRLALKRLGAGRASAIMGFGAVGAALTLALAISGVTRTANPQLALRFVPGESLALATRAGELLATQPLKPPANVKTLALASLKHQALNPKALRVLAYVATAEQNENLARSLIRLSESQSRRDTGTQLWLIEYWVQHGDIGQALKHYDIVLRTHPSTYTTLFPILLQTLGDINIRTALLPYIRSDDNWASHFIGHATANSSDLPALVNLMIESGGLKNPTETRIQTMALLQRLVAANMFHDAQRLYSGTQGTSAARLITADFNASDGTAPIDPMEWKVTSETDAGGSFIAGGRGKPALSLFANPATTATVASKLLYLRRGSYVFTSSLSRFEGNDGAHIRWQLRCPTREGDQPIWSLAGDQRSIRTALSIPADCPVQYLDIIASGGSGANGMNATVDFVSLRAGR